MWAPSNGRPCRGTCACAAFAALDVAYFGPQPPDGGVVGKRLARGTALPGRAAARGLRAGLIAAWPDLIVRPAPRSDVACLLQIRSPIVARAGHAPAGLFNSEVRRRRPGRPGAAGSGLWLDELAAMLPRTLARSPVVAPRGCGSRPKAAAGGSGGTDRPCRAFPAARRGGASGLLAVARDRAVARGDRAAQPRRTSGDGGAGHRIAFRR